MQLVVVVVSEVVAYSWRLRRMAIVTRGTLQDRLWLSDSILAAALKNQFDVNMMSIQRQLDVNFM